MSDVFLSYKKEERTVAASVVVALQSAGYTVWWDDDLTPRNSWDSEIEREIRSAKAVLVLWSTAAVDQATFVRKEAGYALDNKKLVPAQIVRCDLPLALPRHPKVANQACRGLSRRSGVTLRRWRRCA